MIQWLYIDLIVLVTVIAITGIIIPQILLIAFRKQLFDVPDSRKIHKGAVPRLGGIAFAPSILFALFLLIGTGALYDGGKIISHVSSHTLPLCYIGCASIILYLTGMADDLVGVRYSAKFIMQSLSAIFVIAGGICLDNLHGLLGLHELPAAFALILTFVLIIFITNAINLIDGIDGLASGLSAIACGFYTFVFLDNGLYIYSALAAATLGALLPFFYFNVFGDAEKHRKIFMGDTGALTIGLFLSIMAIETCSLPDVAGRDNPGVVGFAPLLIPCLDVVRVYFHRLKGHRSPFLPDKTHIHHKLLALGIGQRRAMLTIIGCSILLIGANYLLSAVVNITILFVCDLLLWCGGNALLTRAIRARESSTGKKLYE